MALPTSPAPAYGGGSSWRDACLRAAARPSAPPPAPRQAVRRPLRPLRLALALALALALDLALALASRCALRPRRGGAALSRVILPGEAVMELAA